MKWITGIFKDRTEKKLISKLLLIAAHEQVIGQDEVHVITQDSNFLSYNQLTGKEERIFQYKRMLPKTAREKFKLVFYLIRSQMKNGALSDEKERILSKLIQVLSLSREKAHELVSFLKSNIRNGLSYEDSFERLGYILEGTKYDTSVEK